MKKLLIISIILFIINGCTTTIPRPHAEGGAVSNRSQCVENYTTSGWQMRHAGGFFAQADDRSYKNQGLKLKLNKISKSGYVCTIRVVRYVELPDWHGKLPAPINFSEYFPECTFGRVYDPNDDSGAYLDVAAAEAFCPGL